MSADVIDESTLNFDGALPVWRLAWRVSQHHRRSFWLGLSLFVAFFTPWKDWSAFSWFVGVVIAALVYYFISASDVRQPELESGPAEQEAQA